MSPLARSNSPMTVLGGQRKSCTAEPSRRNSELLQTPEINPGLLPPRTPLRWGCTIAFVHRARQDEVHPDDDGMARGLGFEGLADLLAMIRRMYRKSRLPFAWLGVPAQTRRRSSVLVDRVEPESPWWRAVGPR